MTHVIGHDNDPNECPECKIIIDGDAMRARLRYAIEALDFQEVAIERLHEAKVKLTAEEVATLLALSEEQCDFAKLVRDQADKTIDTITYIAKEHSGMAEGEEVAP